MKLILACDIGGTKTHFALFTKEGGQLIIHKEKKYPSSSWNTLEEAVFNFLNWANWDIKSIEAASFSLAGPIKNKTIVLTNLNKTINLESLKSIFPENTYISYCNDLVATAAGIAVLKSKDILGLNPDVHKEVYNKIPFNQPGLNRAVLAPGTGLGESIIFANGQITPTEGSHADFAPQSELQIKLWRYLQIEYGHVSYERVLSGPGIVNIYRFLLHEMGIQIGTNYISTDYIGTNNIDTYHRNPNKQNLPTPQEITINALKDNNSLYAMTLDLFIEILGAEAGNLALKAYALGGIFLGGGIPPKILPKLKEGLFLESFQNKGRFREFVASIPVYVILNEKAALYGAAARALDK